MHLENPLPGAGPMEGCQVVVLGESGSQQRPPNSGFPSHVPEPPAAAPRAAFPPSVVKARIEKEAAETPVCHPDSLCAG